MNAEWTAPAIRGLLLLEKPRLKVFHFTVRENNPCDAIREIGACAATLVEFCFYGKFNNFLTEDFFEAVVEGAPLLETVKSLRAWHRDETVEQMQTVAQRAVGCFLKSRKLRQLEVIDACPGIYRSWRPSSPTANSPQAYRVRSSTSSSTLVPFVAHG